VVGGIEACEKQLSPPVQRRVNLAPNSNRLQHIDALRAIAALLVLCTHVTETFYTLSPQTTSTRWLFDVSHNWDFGRMGVVAFFFISGFVIPFSTRPGLPGAGWDFAIRRLFRIYPAYWLSVPAGVFACYWLWGIPFTATDFLVNLTLMQDLVGVRSAIGLYWTLLVELTLLRDLPRLPVDGKHSKLLTHHRILRWSHAGRSRVVDLAWPGTRSVFVLHYLVARPSVRHVVGHRISSLVRRGLESSRRPRRVLRTHWLLPGRISPRLDIFRRTSVAPYRALFDRHRPRPARLDGPPHPQSRHDVARSDQLLDLPVPSSRLLSPALAALPPARGFMVENPTPGCLCRNQRGPNDPRGNRRVCLRRETVHQAGATPGRVRYRPIQGRAAGLSFNGVALMVG
jgi:hypothetical protein